MQCIDLILVSFCHFQLVCDPFGGYFTVYQAEFTGLCRLTMQFLLFSVLVVTIVMYLIKLPFKMMNTLTCMPSYVTCFTGC